MASWGTMSDLPDSGRHHPPGHDHHHPEPGLLSRLRHLLRPHSHEAADQVDTAMESSREGMRTLWIP